MDSDSQNYNADAASTSEMHTNFADNNTNAKDVCVDSPEKAVISNSSPSLNQNSVNESVVLNSEEMSDSSYASSNNPSTSCNSHIPIDSSANNTNVIDADSKNPEDCAIDSLMNTNGKTTLNNEVLSGFSPSKGSIFFSDTPSDSDSNSEHNSAKNYSIPSDSASVHSNVPNDSEKSDVLNDVSDATMDQDVKLEEKTLKSLDKDVEEMSDVGTSTFFDSSNDTVYSRDFDFPERLQLASGVRVLAKEKLSKLLITLLRVQPRKMMLRFFLDCIVGSPDKSHFPYIKLLSPFDELPSDIILPIPLENFPIDKQALASKTFEEPDSPEKLTTEICTLFTTCEFLRVSFTHFLREIAMIFRDCLSQGFSAIEVLFQRLEVYEANLAVLIKMREHFQTCSKDYDDSPFQKMDRIVLLFYIGNEIEAFNVYLLRLEIILTMMREQVEDKLWV